MPARKTAKTAAKSAKAARPAKQAAKNNNNAVANEICGILLIALGIIMAITIYSKSDVLFAVWMRGFFFGLFGLIGYAVPMLMLAGGVLAIIARKYSPKPAKLIAGIMLMLALLAFMQICFADSYAKGDKFFAFLGRCYKTGGTELTGGGLFGGLLAYPATLLLGDVAGAVLLVAIIVACIIALTNFSIRKAGQELGQIIHEKREQSAAEKEAYRNAEHEAAEIYGFYTQEDKEDMPPKAPKPSAYAYVDEPPSPRSRRRLEKVYEKAFTYESDPIPQTKKNLYIEEVENIYSDPYDDLNVIGGSFDDRAESGVAEDDSIFGAFSDDEYDDPFKTAEEQAKETAGWNEPMEIAAEDAPARDIKKRAVRTPAAPETAILAASAQPERKAAQETRHEAKGAKNSYAFPPIELLNPPQNASSTRGEKEEAREKAQLLEETLANFNISAKVINISRGPVVTRFELQPAHGVKVSRIVSLADDIALNLAAPSIRIEAPIPGKAAIGVEVPNNIRTTVTAREMLDAPEFRGMKSTLAFAVGKDIAGNNVYGDLAKMPHLLIAGTTGSGKSVCVNAIIMSILYHAAPDEVQFLMVDPKTVELIIFNGIPHMKTPVITDPKRATTALNWAVNEMILRYKQFAEKGVKDIDRYNKHPDVIAMGQKMPKIVIVIDELADLMMASANEVEDSICRIAQLGRASGIHIVIATQSPRVNVITGLIQANFQSRIALTVSKQVDSRVILDMGGAEKLLKNGDMLYMPSGVNKPIRLQGCFITDAENEAVINFLRGEAENASYDEQLTSQIESGEVSQAGGQSGGVSFDDEMTPRAIDLALEYEQISTSMLQRKLKLGYARAARVMDEMEELGIISPSEGSKPREVLMSRAEYERMMNSGASEEDDYND